MNALNANQSEGKCLNIVDNLEPEKVLGIFWKTYEDAITFKVSASILKSPHFIGGKEPTKREVLKILMSVEEIWRSGVGWDEAILAPQKAKWEKWIALLPQLSSMKIPRCYLQTICDYNNTSVELHTFVDASENGYASVAYCRIRSNNNIIVSLVVSKTRVAPLKLASIPRLELMAA